MLGDVPVPWVETIVKAKDWARDLTTEGADVTVLLQRFVHEVEAVARQRGDSLYAREGAVREGRSKWQAICRLVPGLSAAVYDQVLCQYAPDLARDEYKVRVLLGKAKAPAEPAKVEAQPVPGRKPAEEVKKTRKTPSPALRVGDLKARSRRQPRSKTS